MKLLICGSEGRIMSATIPFLQKAGHEVIGLDTCEKWGQYKLHSSTDYRFVRGSCADPGVLRPLLKGVDGVIQAAATLFGVTGFHRRAADILGNDLNAQQTVLRLSMEAGVGRVVYMSSSMVYERAEKEPYREEEVEHIEVPQTDYGLSKLVGERLSLAFHKQYQLPYTIWRPFNVIDPAEEGSDDAGMSHVFADILYRMIGQQQNPLKVLGDGDQVRSFVHIREVAEALARFSFDQRTENQVFNLGRDECISMRELASRMYDIACAERLIEDPKPLEFQPTPVVSTDVKRRVGFFEKAAQVLGWRSSVSLDFSLRECVIAYRDRNLSRPAEVALPLR
jgi:nucleoside-diphosphate-sugar epimerase